MAVAWLLPALVLAQGGRGGRNRGIGSGTPYMDDFRNQEMTWPIPPGFEEDVFVFARLRHGSGGGIGYGRRVSWAEDFPLADVLLPFRLHQITSLQVRPGPAAIEFTREELAKYPFVYLAGVEQMSFTELEVSALREYLLNGGFVMVDNFWGDAAWANFSEQMKRVFPNRTPVELPLEHQIFHNVYQFKAKPQMPSAGVWARFNVFYDPTRDYDRMGHEPHYFAIYDDKGHMMMVICHNNHYGDGWEHEGDDVAYFHTISEGMAYPMFVNILTYAMSH